MRKFIIKKAQHDSKGDPFGFTEAKDHLYLFAAGLKDLRNTIRCATPPGYGIRSHRWFSNHILSGSLVMINPLLLTVMYEVLEINFTPEIEREMEYENKGGFKHKLKIISPEIWEKTSKDTV